MKGDAILEYPLRDLLNEHDIPYHHTRPGASGAQETAERYGGMSPGPDFVIPDEAPTLVVESKVGEDGGTVRDKAARIKKHDDRGGRGWSHAMRSHRRERLDRAFGCSVGGRSRNPGPHLHNGDTQSDP